MGLAIPLAWIGSELFELTGVFLGIVAANGIMGIVAGLYARREIWTLAAGLQRPAVEAAAK